MTNVFIYDSWLGGRLTAFGDSLIDFTEWMSTFVDWLICLLTQLFTGSSIHWPTD